MPGKQRGPYRVGLPSKRRCWTCRDRKVACDQGRPECRNCILSNRKCHGYGLRLSWPAHGSSRLIEHRVQDCRTHPTSENSRNYFVNTSMADVELHYRRKYQTLAKLSLRRIHFISMSNLAKAQPRVDDAHHLVTFFMTTVVGSLTPSQSEAYKLWKLLFQLSFSDDSPASMAVLRAMLSLAALYRYGHGEESLRLKVAALNSLNKSIGGIFTGAREIYQHTAVVMLICIFEIYLPSESSFQWPLYLSGAKHMLHTFCSRGHPKLAEFDIITLWVHYHDIMGKFTSRHDTVHSTVTQAFHKIPGMASTLLVAVPNDKVLGILGCSLEMLDIIARIAELQPYRHNDVEAQHVDKNTLDRIEHDLLTINQNVSAPIENDFPEDIAHKTKISQLYQLATLIYFERAMKKYPDTARVKSWSDEAFDLIRDLDYCERSFPLFLVACEAHTETEREAILSIIDRAHGCPRQRILFTLKRMILSMWVQHDLLLDLDGMKESSYVDNLDVIISSNELLPPLA